MTITYTIAITGAPLGDAVTGVIKQVAWTLTGSDGTYSASQSDVAVLPPIDPDSPGFIPLAEITVPVMLQWAQRLINLPYRKSLIEADIAAQRLAQPPVFVTPLELAPSVAAIAAAGVPL